ncbi:hypothetical protein AB395_00004352 (plasmid) [Sinorhizobium fredii CCBAU 45436]|nr:hypothetical protein AB395_00004352 [Sinorhizobium fredii CCBAU 45436]
MAAREHMLDGTVEIDHFHLGGRPNKSGRSAAWTRPKRSAEYPEDTGHGDGAATR